MRYHSYMLTLLAVASHSFALPDGVGGHHGHHSEHGAAAAAPSGYGSPDASYSSPDAGYASPDAGYAAPDSGYGAPDAGYGAPDAGYAAPDAGYAEPSYNDYGNYAAPGSGYGEAAAAENGMSMIIIPLLIAAALFLLFPSVTTVPVRKRRDVDESPASNLIERAQDMYMAILESEECIERVVCELGGLVEDAGYSKQMTKTMEVFAPKKYAKMMKSFNHGKNCKKNNKCGVF